MSWFFGKQSEPEEQGGFSDTTSKITYTNDSKEEALNQAAQFEEREDGSMLTTKNDTDARQSPDDARFNCTVMDTDSKGSEYPARYRPGK
jgi:hypothetical protein